LRKDLFIQDYSSDVKAAGAGVSLSCSQKRCTSVFSSWFACTEESGVRLQLDFHYILLRESILAAYTERRKPAEPLFGGLLVK